MDPRAAERIARLGLVAHPEGGYFRETWRSTARVVRASDGATRAAMTSILFLLPAGAWSAWHRVDADELWLHVEGDPLDLHVAATGMDGVATIRIGPVGSGLPSAATVPARRWQAARSSGAYTLVACVVAPGFEADDFALLRDEPAGRGAVAGLGEGWDAYLEVPATPDEGPRT